MKAAHSFVRLAVLVVFFALWYIVYAALNARGADQCVYWASPGLYVPAAVWVYFFGACVIATLPFVWHWEGGSFARLLSAYAATSLVFFAVYAVYPVCMSRDPYDGPTVADALMRIVVGLDDQANCFPSSHCMFSTMGFLGLVRGGAPRWLLVSGGCLAAAVCVSTVLVGQHYLADVVVGVVGAAGLFVLTYDGFYPALARHLGRSGALTERRPW